MTCATAPSPPPLSSPDFTSLQALKAAASSVPAGLATNVLATWSPSKPPCHEIDPLCLVCDFNTSSAACGGTAPSDPATPTVPRWYCNYQGVTCEEGRVTGLNLTNLLIVFGSIPTTFYLEKAENLRERGSRGQHLPLCSAASQAAVVAATHSTGMQAPPTTSVSLPSHWHPGSASWQQHPGWSAAYQPQQRAGERPPHWQRCLDRQPNRRMGKLAPAAGPEAAQHGADRCEARGFGAWMSPLVGPCVARLSTASCSTPRTPHTSRLPLP